MRLIDADTIFGSKLIAVREAAYDEVQVIFDRINNAPTIDAAPVRHGRWVELENAYECSFCGIIRRKGVTGHYAYCPNCGAKMDKGEE